MGATAWALQPPRRRPRPLNGTIEDTGLRGHWHSPQCRHYAKTRRAPRLPTQTDTTPTPPTPSNIPHPAREPRAPLRATINRTPQTADSGVEANLNRSGTGARTIPNKARGTHQNPRHRRLGLDNLGIAPLDNSSPKRRSCGETDWDEQTTAPTSQNFNGPQNTTTHNQRRIQGFLRQPRTPTETRQTKVLARNPNTPAPTYKTLSPLALLFPSKTTGANRTTTSGLVATLLGLAPARTALRPAPLRAALGRTLGLPLAALLRGRLPARGTSLRRHGSNDSELRVQQTASN